MENLIDWVKDKLGISSPEDIPSAEDYYLDPTIKKLANTVAQKLNENKDNLDIVYRRQKGWADHVFTKTFIEPNPENQNHRTVYTKEPRYMDEKGQGGAYTIDHQVKNGDAWESVDKAVANIPYALQEGKLRQLSVDGTAAGGQKCYVHVTDRMQQEDSFSIGDGELGEKLVISTAHKKIEVENGKITEGAAEDYTKAVAGCAEDILQNLASAENPHAIIDKASMGALTPNANSKQGSQKATSFTID